MDKSEKIYGVEVSIVGDYLEIGKDFFRFDRASVREIVSFAQDWLDYDPEEELVKRVNRLRSDWDISDATEEIIKAVRDHDAKHRRA